MAASVIEEWVDANRAGLVAGFRAASPWWAAWLVGRMAPTLARVTLEVSSRALALLGVPFLRGVLAAEGLMDAGWAYRAKVVLSMFELPADALHPATVAALRATAPGLVDASAFDDPSTAVFVAAVGAPDPARAAHPIATEQS